MLKKLQGFVRVLKYSNSRSTGFQHNNIYTIKILKHFRSKQKIIRLFIFCEMCFFNLFDCPLMVKIYFFPIFFL